MFSNVCFFVDGVDTEQREDIPSNNQADQSTPSTSSSTTPSPAFKHKSTKLRSLARVEKSLPKSPGKQAEIIKMMASKHLKIRFQGKGGGRTKNVLTFAEEEWLSAILDRADISPQTPRRKDNVFIGKVNSEKQYAQKRYLQWTIRELLGIINGKIPVEKFSTFPDSFDKDLTFRQLYDFLKTRKQYRFCNQTPHESCTSEICKNITLSTSSINRKMKNLDSKIPNNVKELIEEYSCDVSNAD